MKTGTNIYSAAPSAILDIKKHTTTEWSFTMDYETECAPGKFVMVSVPGAGEVPISVSGFMPDSIELTIRKTGQVTAEIFNVKKGGYLYIRGPYGNTFPLESFSNEHILIIAGGSAMAAVKPLIEYHFNKKEYSFKKLDILAGFRSPRHILFREKLKRWEKRCRVVVTVDNDEDYAWMGSIGFVVSYVKDVESIGEGTKVVVIGPPLMMTNTVRELLNHRVKEENIYLSFERHMKCGVGKCGHCRIRDKYVCIDGPVFAYKEAKELLD